MEMNAKNSILEECAPSLHDRVVRSGPGIFMSFSYGALGGFVVGSAMAGVGTVPGGLIGGAAGLVGGIGRTLFELLQPTSDAECVADKLITPRVIKNSDTIQR